MNKDIRSISSIFGGNPNYLQRTKYFSWSTLDKRGYKVSLYYTPTKPGVVEVFEPPSWMGVKVDSFGVGFIDISDLPLFFENKNYTNSW